MYLASPKGEIELAPDGRLTRAQLDKIGYKHWRRCEAVGAREIDKISLILSKQQFENKKKLKVAQTLREMNVVKQGQIAARLRRAQNYSKADVEANEMLEKRWIKREQMALDAITAEFTADNRTSGLEMERRERSTSRLAHIGNKPEGIAS